jgi:hypothetical protein
MPGFQDIVAAMSAAGFSPDRPVEVPVRETAISFVFLAGDRVKSRDVV